MDGIRAAIDESRLNAHTERLAELENSHEQLKLQLNVYHQRLGIVEKNTEEIKDALIGDFQTRGFISDYKEHKKRCDDIQAEKSKIKDENRGQWMGLKFNLFTMLEKVFVVGLFIWLFRALGHNSEVIASIAKEVIK